MSSAIALHETFFTEHASSARPTPYGPFGLLMCRLRTMIQMDPDRAAATTNAP